MDLVQSTELTAFRLEVHRWLCANKPELPMPPGETTAGAPVNLAWERVLYESGYAAVTWPEKFGGRGLDLWHWLVFEEEYFKAGLPQRMSINGMSLLAPALLEFGTPDQQERYLRRIASVEDIWCQGWSEPEAGSDLASLRAVARRDEDRQGWTLYGQKAWSTRGAFSNRLFGLFRTGPTDSRHRGLTYLLVDLHQPGVEIRPVKKFDGTIGFADVFFDGAFVADGDVLGDVDGGWHVAMMTTGNERSLALRAPGRFIAAADRLIGLYRSASTSVRSDDRIREAVARAWMRAQEYDLSTAQTVTRVLEGGQLGAESSLSKVFWSELDIDLTRTALDILGADGALEGAWMSDYLFSLAGPIYAGTNEIQRSIIGERLLGLPRK